MYAHGYVTNLWFGYPDEVSLKFVKDTASFSKALVFIILVCKIDKSGKWREVFHVSKILVKSSVLTKFERNF